MYGWSPEGRNMPIRLRLASVICILCIGVFGIGPAYVTYELIAGAIPHQTVSDVVIVIFLLFFLATLGMVMTAGAQLGLLVFLILFLRVLSREEMITIMISAVG